MTRTSSRQKVTVDVGDVEIGAVELKDASSSLRANVVSDGTNNVLVVKQNTQPLPTGAATEATSNNIFTTIGAQNDAAVTPGAVGSVQGKLRQISSDIETALTPYENRVARGEVTGQSVVTRAGRNLDVDTAAEEDIWTFGGVWTPITAAQTVTVVSSSAADTAAGTGARVIQITGLNASYAITTEIIVLNGVTPVVSVGTWTFIATTEVVSSGTGATNAGNITVTATTDTTVQSYVLIGYSTSASSFYMVPAGYYGEFHGASGASSNGTAGTLTNIYIKYKVDGTNTWVRPVAYRSRADGDAAFDRNIEFPYIFPPKTIIKFSADTSNNNTVVDVFYQLLLRLI